MQMVHFFLCFCGLTFLAGCMAPSTKIQPGDDDGVHDPAQITVQDYETVAQQMVRSMVRIPQIQNAANPPMIAFLEVENRSNDYLDKKAFLEKMRTLFIKHSGGKLVFLDRDKLEDLKTERDEKEAGELTSSSKTQFLGADYFLTGVISTISRGAGDKKSVFRRFSFRLTAANSSAIVWEDEYETQLLHKRAWVDM